MNCPKCGIKLEEVRTGTMFANNYIGEQMSKNVRYICYSCHSTYREDKTGIAGRAPLQ